MNKENIESEEMNGLTKEQKETGKFHANEIAKKRGRFEGSGTELVGGVTIGLGPPRSLIQLKKNCI